MESEKRDNTAGCGVEKVKGTLAIDRLSYAGGGCPSSTDGVHGA